MATTALIQRKTQLVFMGLYGELSKAFKISEILKNVLSQFLLKIVKK